MAELHVGDEGTLIKWTLTDGTTPLDLTNFTTLETKYKKANGVEVTRPLAFEGDGSDGRVQYTVETGFLEVGSDGSWDWQHFLVATNGRWHTIKGSFTVFPTIF